ncbi:hypothetical protein LZC95_33660 [Pendulispora brunnea]|uniref:Uncharacterized protein n=1 Tax=Pendulispora brunnea TaxID=2905690 RepID=A0ABZ2JY66_9BACT
MNAKCACKAGSRAAFATGLLAMIAPKCPLCLAGYLAFLGFGSTAARSIAPLLLPMGIAFLVASVAMFGIYRAKLARARQP